MNNTVTRSTHTTKSLRSAVRAFDGHIYVAIMGTETTVKVTKAAILDTVPAHNGTDLEWVVFTFKRDGYHSEMQIEGNY